MIVETEKNNLPKSDFVAWKNDPSTQFIFGYLASIAAFHKEQLQSRELICSTHGQLRLSYLRGYIDAIEDVLNMHPVSEDNNEG